MPMEAGDLAQIKENCCDASNKDVISAVEKAERSIKEAIGLTREAAKEAEDAARQSGAAVSAAVQGTGLVHYLNTSAVGRAVQEASFVSWTTLILLAVGYAIAYLTKNTDWDFIARLWSYFSL